MRKLGNPEFEELKKFKHKDNESLEKFIIDTAQENGLEVIDIFGQTDWKRKLLLLKNTI